MSKVPLFSIIIPVKGRFNFVKEAIKSIYNQKNINPESFEIIIAEDKNSPESILKKIKKLYPEIITVFNKYENYAGGSRNSGLEMASGKYIVFLDSDDKLKPNFLFQSAKTLTQDKNCSATVCFSNALFIPAYNFKERVKWITLMLIRDSSLLLSYFINHEYLFNSAFYLCQISHMMFKKERIKEMKFNYQYHFGGEDWDFINRVQNNGPIRIIPRILTIFRYSYNSSTVLPEYKKLKWQSYLRLSENLSPRKKTGIYYKLFLLYIKLFKS